MSENLNRDFSQYETMSTEELEEILRLDAEAPAGAQTDTELILFILEVLASRRNKENIAGNTAQKAWESFQQHYMPEEPEKPLKTNKSTNWMRRFVAAAAVVALLILIPISTNALTMEEVWNIFARWAKETFSFVSSEDTEVSQPSPEDVEAYTSLYAALADNNRNPDIVPTQIPSQFVLEKIEVDITPVQEVYRAFYLNGDEELRIRVQNYLSHDFQKLEINGGYSETYLVSDVVYYLFDNMEQNRAVWTVDSYECIISGDLSIEEIKLMIDSIGKG